MASIRKTKNNPEGRKILGEEFDKTVEEMKKKINDGEIEIS